MEVLMLHLRMPPQSVMCLRNLLAFLSEFFHCPRECNTEQKTLTVQLAQLSLSEILPGSLNLRPDACRNYSAETQESLLVPYALPDAVVITVQPSKHLTPQNSLHLEGKITFLLLGF